MAGKTVNVHVTEYFPGYQCSINNMDWSPAVMFDAVTPFPDVRKNYFPIAIADGWFPVVDELGSPLGIEIQPVSANITYEYASRLSPVPASASPAPWRSSLTGRATITACASLPLSTCRSA